MIDGKERFYSPRLLCVIECKLVFILIEIFRIALIYTGILKIKGRAASVCTAFLEGRLEGKKLESVIKGSKERCCRNKYYQDYK